jgi:hypothetical protein
MRMKMKPLTLALALSLAAGGSANADLVIKGRAAQALHCSAMLSMVSGALAQAGMIAPQEADRAMIGAAMMLDHVPGTKAQKMQAMRQRYQRIMASRSLLDLLGEYTSTAKWCNAHFLPR